MKGSRVLEDLDCGALCSHQFCSSTGLSSFASLGMALATPASVFCNPIATAVAPCRDVSNDGARPEFAGAAVAVATREPHAAQWVRCRHSCARRPRVSCLLGGNKRVRQFWAYLTSAVFQFAVMYFGLGFALGLGRCNGDFMTALLA